MVTQSKTLFLLLALFRTVNHLRIQRGVELTCVWCGACSDGEVEVKHTEGGRHTPFFPLFFLHSASRLQVWAWKTCQTCCQRVGLHLTLQTWLCTHAYDTQTSIRTRRDKQANLSGVRIWGELSSLPTFERNMQPVLVVSKKIKNKKFLSFPHSVSDDGGVAPQSRIHTVCLALFCPPPTNLSIHISICQLSVRLALFLKW